MVTDTAPNVAPVVESAEPTSKSASWKLTPMVEKSNENTINTVMNRSIDANAGKASDIVLLLFLFFVFFVLVNANLKLCPTDVPRVKSLAILMPPAIENAHPPINITVVRIESTLAFEDIFKNVVPAVEDKLTT